MNGKDPEPSAEEGCWDVRVVNALYQSAQTGKPVELNHFGPEDPPTRTAGAGSAAGVASRSSSRSKSLTTEQAQATVAASGAGPASPAARPPASVIATFRSGGASGAARIHRQRLLVEARIRREAAEESGGNRGAHLRAQASRRRRAARRRRAQSIRPG